MSVLGNRSGQWAMAWPYVVEEGQNQQQLQSGWFRWYHVYCRFSAWYGTLWNKAPNWSYLTFLGMVSKHRKSTTVFKKRAPVKCLRQVVRQHDLWRFSPCPVDKKCLQVSLGQWKVPLQIGADPNPGIWHVMIRAEEIWLTAERQNKSARSEMPRWS